VVVSLSVDVHVYMTYSGSVLQNCPVGASSPHT